MPTPSPHTQSSRISALSLLLVVFALGLACAPKAPALSTYADPEVSLERFRTVALDPRTDIIWSAEGQRAVQVPPYLQAVIRELEAKGYRMVEPGEAELWLDVFGLVPRDVQAGRGEGMAPGGMGRGGGMRGGPGGHGGGMRGGPMGGGPPQGGGGHGGGQPGMASGETPRPSGPPPGQMPEIFLEGELTLEIRLLRASDQKTVWYASAAYPAPAKGKPRSFQDTPEARAGALMASLPGHAGGEDRH